MADERIKDFTGEVSSAQLQALLNTLYLATDDTSFTEAKKLLLKSILTSAIVSANTNTYQAMTPKAFYDSVMSTVAYGIGIVADAEDVAEKIGAGLLNAASQTVMQSQWFADWFYSNGIPKHFERDSAVGRAMSFDVNFYNTATLNTKYTISPALPVGRTIAGIYFNVVVKTSASSNVYSGTYTVKYTGGEITVRIAGVPLDIGIAADGRSVFLKQSYTTTTTVTLSAHFNLIMN